MTDKTILTEIGIFIKKERLSQDITQAQLARDAGIGRSSVVQIEKGFAVSIAIFLRVLRGLGRLDVLDNFVFEPIVSPLALAKAEKKKRRRASGLSDYTT